MILAEEEILVNYKFTAKFKESYHRNDTKGDKPGALINTLDQYLVNYDDVVSTAVTTYVVVLMIKTYPHLKEAFMKKGEEMESELSDAMYRKTEEFVRAR